MARQGGMRWRAAAVAGALAIVAGGVETTAAEKGGKRSAREAPPRKVLVMAVSASASVRAAFEDVIAGEFQLRGVPAVASHLMFPDLPRERGPFEARLEEEGFDAVTVSRVVGKDHKLAWREGTGTYEPVYEGRDAWGGYWYTYEQVFLPGYLETETRVRVRTDLWRASSRETGPAWSGTSELIDPLTVVEAAREVGVSLVKALSKARII